MKMGAHSQSVSVNSAVDGMDSLGTIIRVAILLATVLSKVAHTINGYTCVSSEFK